jgi:hypothetical protein
VPCCDPNPLLEPPDEVAVLRGTPEGTIFGQIFDNTNASGYQVYRREPGGGLDRLFDFVVGAAHKWLDTGWEYYTFTDFDTSYGASASYQARGLFDGIATSRSPLTNPSTTSRNDTIWVIDVAADTLPRDSALTIMWSGVRNAAHYIIDVFTLRPDARTLEEQVQWGAPAPVSSGRVRDMYVASVPSDGQIGLHFYRVGEPGPTEFTHHRMFSSSTNRNGDRVHTAISFPWWTRVSAIDAQGRMIGTSLGQLRWPPLQGEGFWISWYTGGPVFPRCKIEDCNQGGPVPGLGAVEFYVRPSVPIVGSLASAMRERGVPVRDARSMLASVPAHQTP